MQSAFLRRPFGWQLCALGLLGCTARTFRHDSGTLTDDAMSTEVLDIASADSTLDAPEFGDSSQEIAVGDAPADRVVVEAAGPSSCMPECAAGQRCFQGICGPDAELSVGQRATCLRVAERVTCWGDNRWGEFGTGNTESSVVPGMLWSAVPPVKSITAAGFETYFVGQDGTVRFAGRNVLGSALLELCPGTESWWCGGRDTPTAMEVHSPRQITELSNVRSIAAPAGLGGRACALREDGTVQCFGYNDNATLGIGDSNRYSTPVFPFGFDTPGINSVGVTVVAGCALRGQVPWCWGMQPFGSMGARPFNAQQMRGYPLVSLIAGGSQHLCVVAGADRHVECMGWCGGFGQCSTPIPSDNFNWNFSTILTSDEMPLSNITQLSAGYSASCARTSTGQLWCWGDNSNGILGPGAPPRNRAVRVRMPGDATVVQVSVGQTAACALGVSGNVFCWGKTAFGLLGVPADTDTRPPFQTFSLDSVRDR